MKKLIIATTATFLTLGGVGIQAQTQLPTGPIDWCMSSKPLVHQEAWCYGYLMGMTHALNAWKGVAGESAKICVPKKLSSGQLRDVVRAFYEKSDVKEQAINDIVLFAFHEKWPCPTTSGEVPNGTVPGKVPAKTQD